MTWNNIADNCLFILSEYGGASGASARKLANDKKEPKTLVELMPDLLELYDKVYAFDFFIYKSSKNQTIIEIEYTSKWPDIAQSMTPSLHAKVSIPFYATEVYTSETKRKFDINWQQNNWRHKWNMFWARLRFKVFILNRQIRNRK
ncbi:hypothetical protein [Mucilaginibacter flavidus]|uniref:hypothetical protein n=1 Tax=Mucilaginibacter flavidus TaxID=2949309 RepID=UPI002092F891|nr:hypothetical protein [Mucilaginibacter flavidus]MCO5949161.1 hypothetical protein [Mucilaginibacter flavidus]